MKKMSMKKLEALAETVGLPRLWAAVNVAKPNNGFTTTAWIESGWTAQPAYEGVK